MTADRWTRMVRQQVGLGRFLPLGGRHDGAWIAERAAGAVLRRAAERDVPEVRLDGIRIGLADPGAAAEPAVPAPPSALPPGPLRLTAEFAATAAWPLTETVSRLRAALAVAATERIGLEVTEVDLRVTDLLDTEPATGGRAGVAQAPGRDGAGGTTDVAGGTAEPHGVAATAGASVTPGAAQDAGVAARTPGVTDTSEDSGGSEADRVAGVVLGVPGVSRLTGVWGRPVRLGEQTPAAGDALPRRHARVDLAVAAGFRPLEVARAVRAAVAAAGPDRPTVAVLVTDLD